MYRDNDTWRATVEKIDPDTWLTTSYEEICTLATKLWLLGKHEQMDGTTDFPVTG